MVWGKEEKTHSKGKERRRLYSSPAMVALQRRSVAAWRLSCCDSDRPRERIKEQQLRCRCHRTPLQNHHRRWEAELRKRQETGGRLWKCAWEIERNKRRRGWEGRRIKKFLKLTILFNYRELHIFLIIKDLSPSIWNSDKKFVCLPYYVNHHLDTIQDVCQIGIL